MNYSIPDYDNIMQVIADKKANTEKWCAVCNWDGKTSDPSKEGRGRPYYPRKGGREFLDGGSISNDQLARYAAQRRHKREKDKALKKQMLKLQNS